MLFRSNSLVLQALQSMHGFIPLTFHSHLSDWQHTEGILTYKGHIYILSNLSLHKAILACCHNHTTAGHPGYLKTRQLVASEFWWPGLVAFVHKHIDSYVICQQNKSNTHPTVPPLTPICLIATYLFQRSPMISSLTFPSPAALALFWSWLTMDLLRR